MGKKKKVIDKETKKMLKNIAKYFEHHSKEYKNNDHKTKLDEVVRMIGTEEPGKETSMKKINNLEKISIRDVKNDIIDTTYKMDFVDREGSAFIISTLEHVFGTSKEKIEAITIHDITKHPKSKELEIKCSVYAQMDFKSPNSIIRKRDPYCESIICTKDDTEIRQCEFKLKFKYDDKSEGYTKLTITFDTYGLYREKFEFEK